MTTRAEVLELLREVEAELREWATGGARYPTATDCRTYVTMAERLAALAATLAPRE